MRHYLTQWSISCQCSRQCETGDRQGPSGSWWSAWPGPWGNHHWPAGRPGVRWRPSCSGARRCQPSCPWGNSLTPGKESVILDSTILCIIRVGARERFWSWRDPGEEKMWLSPCCGVVGKNKSIKFLDGPRLVLPILVKMGKFLAIARKKSFYFFTETHWRDKSQIVSSSGSHRQEQKSKYFLA